MYHLKCTILLKICDTFEWIIYKYVCICRPKKSYICSLVSNVNFLVIHYNEFGILCIRSVFLKDVN